MTPTASELQRVIMDWGDYKEELVAPRIEQHFSSPMLNTENYRISREAVQHHLIDRVLNGLKPIGFTDSREHEPLRPYLSQLALAHNPYLFTPYQARDKTWSCYFLSVAVEGWIKDVFDLDALEADYHQWYQDDAEACAAVSSEIEKLRPRAVSDFLSFHQLEAKPPGYGFSENPAAEYLRTGLLLGYPTQSTAALVGSALKLPGFAIQSCR